MLVLGLKEGDTIVMREESPDGKTPGRELQRFTLVEMRGKGARFRFEGDPTIEINRGKIDRAKHPAAYAK